MKKYILLLFAIFTLSIANAQWQQCNGPYGGTIKALFVNGTTIFAGTGSNGVYKSTDNGANWISADSGITTKSAYAFALRDTILYVGTRNGVFQSINNGLNWIGNNNNLINDVMGNPVYSLATNDTTIFAGTLMSLYVLNNNANYWISKSDSLSNYIILSLAVSGVNVFAGTYGGGIYFSSDNGINWDTLNKGLPMPIGIGAFLINGTDIFAGTDYGVYKYNTNDTSWSVIGLSGYKINSLAIKDTNIYAGTNNGLFLSTDNGNNWISINNGLTFSQINTIAINGSNIFVGTEYGGVFLSTNNGVSWTAVNNGIRATTAYPLAKIGSDTIYTSCTYSGLFKSVNNGLDWSPSNINLNGSEIRILAIDGSTIFASNSSGDLFRSTDNGLNWITVKHFVQDTIVFSIAISGSNIFAGTEYSGVYLSTDNGINWTSINNGLTSSNYPKSFGIVAIIDTNIFVVNESCTLFVSSNNGTSWHQINCVIGTISSIVKFDNNLIYSNSSNGLYQITFNGTNWISTCRNSNIDLIPLCVSGTNIFATNGNSAIGVYLSSDTGTTWIPVYEGLNDSIISSLTTNGTYLFAGTQGGVWRRPLSEMVGINELQYIKPEAIRVFPNPATNLTSIVYPQLKEDGDILIYNMLGQIVYEEKITKGSSQMELNIKNYKAGLYKIILREKGMIKGEVSLVKD